MKHKHPNLLMPLGTIIQENYWSFYPSEPFRILLFNMRHPVVSPMRHLTQPTTFNGGWLCKRCSWLAPFTGLHTKIHTAAINFLLNKRYAIPWRIYYLSLTQPTTFNCGWLCRRCSWLSQLTGLDTKVYTAIEDLLNCILISQFVCLLLVFGIFSIGKL